MVKLENMVLEAIFDTRGAKTIISRDLAYKVNWEVETPLDFKSFSSYLGPRGKPTRYFCCIPRPIGIRFGLDSIVNVQEIKVVKHVDLLFWIRVDILCGGSGGSGAQNTSFNSIWVLRAVHK